MENNHMLAIVLLIALLTISGMTNANNNIYKESFVVAKYISENTPGSCKEMNLRLYWWFRSNNISPLVQIGKKNGQGHLWLDNNGIIYDVTDYRYHGKRAAVVKDIYKLSEYEFKG